MAQHWFNKAKFKTFAADLKILIDSAKKVSESVEKSNDRKKESHKTEWRPAGENNKKYF